MLKEIHKDGTLLKVLLILLIIAVTVHLMDIFWQFISIFSDVIGVLVLSWLLSFVLEPLVDYITDIFKVSKTIATILTYILILLGFVGIAFVLIPLVQIQIVTLTRVLPLFLASSPKFITNWANTFADSLTNILVFIPSIAQFFLSTIIVLVISFYFIIDKDRINKEFFYLTPKDWHERMRFIQKVTATTFASFIRVQIMIGLIIGISTWIVMTIFRIDFALTISILAGIFGMLPFIGNIIAIIPPVLFAFIINPWLGLITLAIFIIIQQFIFNVFVPKALGKAFQVHPVIIILSLVVGLKVAGIMGAIFAIPIAGIAAVIVRDIWHSLLKKDDKWIDSD